MKKLLIILIILSFVMPVLAQDATTPVEPVSRYDGIIAGLIAVIAFLTGLAGWLGHKTSTLIPPEFAAATLRLAEMTPTKTDEEKLTTFYRNQGYKVDKVGNVWIVTPPPTTVSTGGTGSGTITTGGVSPGVTPIPK